MFRRSLQSALLERSSNPNQDLIDQIKNASFLTQDIKDWAHNIRIFGNWGAHPQDDNLKEADESVAKEAQSFLEEFFNYVYVMPDRVAKARAPKEQKKDGE
jgi:predicted PurR-regulated permease PerM